METETEKQEPTRDAIVAAWLEKHGVTYSAEFVPFSKSRNAKPGATVHDVQINWTAVLKKDARTFRTDYQQGVGFLPKHLHNKYGQGYSIHMAGEVWETCETGKAPRPLPEYQNWSSFQRVALIPPTAADVLECLALDASVMDSACFEDWASEFGYETDSRKAEATYRECLNLALGMRATIGSAAFYELRAIDWSA